MSSMHIPPPGMVRNSAPPSGELGKNLALEISNLVLIVSCQNPQLSTERGKFQVWLSEVFSFVSMVDHSSFMCPWHMAWPCLTEDELPEVRKL